MRKLLLTLSAAFFFVIAASAQDRTITGRVTNEKNEPIEGASVLSDNGKQGTQSTSYGKSISNNSR